MVVLLNPIMTPHKTAFLTLSKNWRNAYIRLGRMEGPRRETDLDVLAALLIAVEYPDRLSMECFQIVTACRELASNRMYPWIDDLPWAIVSDKIAESLQLGSEHTFDYDIVCDHLGEPNSALRLWAMEVAWFVRDQLNPDQTLPRLFANVAGTLAHVTTAWGLAATFFPDMERFHQAADEYEPEEFQDQYAQRKEFYQKIYPTNWQAHFWNLEAQLRQRIQQAIEAIFTSSAGHQQD